MESDGLIVCVFIYLFIVCMYLFIYTENFKYEVLFPLVKE